MFDARLSLARRSDLDIANLAYFGARGALVSISPDEPFDDGRSLVLALCDAADAFEQRVLGAMPESLLLVGVDERSRPDRRAPELLNALETLARRFDAGAVGPTSLADPLFEDLAELAVSEGLPLLVDLGDTPAGTPTDVLAALSSFGLAPERVVFLGVDYTNVRAALASGAHFILDLEPDQGGAGAVDLLIRYGDQAFRRAVLASAGEEAFDVIALSSARDRLVASGVRRDLVVAATGGNARAFFGRSAQR